MRRPPRPALIPFWLLLLGLLIAIPAMVWGDWRGYFAHPARAGLAAVQLLLGAAAIFSGGGGLRAGRREDRRNRWVLVPLVLLVTTLLWLPAYTDRHNLWSLEGEFARYAGLGLYLAGGLFRVGAIYTLGHRFSGLVAVQPEHALATSGLYQHIRHPSYLGMVLMFAGTALVFRSALGLALVLLLLVPLAARMNAEERFLRQEFGDDYAAYQRRTWRLLPRVY